MTCPCGTQARVTTTTHLSATVTRRYLRCPKCDLRLTTYEQPQGEWYKPRSTELPSVPEKR